MDLIKALNAINQDKKNIIRDSESPTQAEKMYPKFPVQRMLANHLDAVLYVNDLNVRGTVSYGITNRQHFEYLLYSLPKKKRFGKFDKSQSEDRITTIMNYLKYSELRAREVADMFTDDDIIEMEKRLSPGGTSPK